MSVQLPANSSGEYEELPPLQLEGEAEFVLAKNETHLGNVTLRVPDPNGQIETIRFAAMDINPVSSGESESWTHVKIANKSGEKDLWVKREDIPIPKVKQIAATVGITAQSPIRPTWESLSKEEQESILKQITDSGKQLAKAQPASTVHTLEEVSTFTSPTTKSIKAYHFKHLQFAILTSEEDLGSPQASGSYKDVRKVTALVSSSTAIFPDYALAIVKPKTGKPGEVEKSAQFAMREVTFLKNLKNKPGVIPIDNLVYYREKDGVQKVGMLMHFASEGDLSKNLAKIGTDNQKKEVALVKLGICNDIADGLISCHKEGIINSDLKPDNILLDQGQDKLRAYVSDFGLAFQPNTSDVTLPKTWQGGSKPCFSPELWEHYVLGSGEVTSKIDAFAFGLTMHQLFFGTPLKWSNDLCNIDPVNYDRSLFPGAKNLAVQTLNTERREIRKKEPFGAIIDRLLDPNPDTRMSVDEAKKEIEKLVAKYNEESKVESSKPLIAAGPQQQKKADIVVPPPPPSL